MELTLEQALQKGVEAHKAGKVQEADRYYTAILKANPKHSDANHNMGVLAVGVGKGQEALQFFKTAVEANPNIAQYWSSYIDALIKLERTADAKAVFAQAKSNGAKDDSFDKLEVKLGLAGPKNLNEQEPPKEQLDSLIKLYNQNRLQHVFNETQFLTKRYTKSPTLWNLMGTSAAQIGQLDNAILAFQKALLIKPDSHGAYYNMGMVLQDQGKMEEAKEAYTKALSIKPDYAEAYNNLGNALQKQGKLDEAIEAYNKALAIKPDYAQAYINMGIAFKEQGKLEEAIEASDKALSINPDFAESHNNLGNALRDQGKLEEAIEAYTTALSVKPDYAEVQNNLGIILQEQGKLDEAVEAYNKALAIKPDYAEAHRNLSLIKKYTVEDEQFLKVEKLFTREDLSEEVRCVLSFALHKMYEDVGELNQAFSHLSKGNTLRKKLLKYTIDQDEKLFNKLKITQPNLLKNSLAVEINRTISSPIFILGMPRSGTTLVEQILSSHSAILGSGELGYISKLGLNLAVGSASINTATISEFRESYLSELSKVSDGKQLVTDKTPQNFRFIPLICAAFPEAKIIHVQRSAAATCWSNYKQYFVSNGLGYCYDLRDVVEYYTLYIELMKLWQSHYGDRIYNLNYESITTDQENQTRKLIEHLGLNWEEICLSPQKNKRIVRTVSQQQVRKKVYKGSSDAWRKYEPYLNGAFDNLLF